MWMVRPSRAQAVEFAKKQMNCEKRVFENIDGTTFSSGCKTYGKHEIQELLDFIYGHNSKGEKVDGNLESI